MMQGLRRHLLEELEQTFPDEVEAYRDIRAASAAVSYYFFMVVTRYMCETMKFLLYDIFFTFEF